MTFASKMAGRVFQRQRRKQNISMMRECCYNGWCFNNFKDMADHIGDIEGVPLFEYFHESPEGHMINKVPKGYNWGEFLFDFWDFTSQQDFKEEFTTLAVNHNGHGKLFCNWCVLDRYKTHYQGYSLTRNMVDVRLYIPECNLKMEEHFCYKYFSQSWGNPASLVENILKEAMAKLYD